MKVQVILSSLVLVAGLVFGSDVKAQENSPEEIGRAIHKLAKKFSSRSEVCWKLGVFLKANSDDIESGYLTDNQIETFARLSDGCSAKAEALFEAIDEANSYLDGGDDGDDDGDDGDFGGEPMKAAAGVSSPMPSPTATVTTSSTTTASAQITATPYATATRSTYVGRKVVNTTTATPCPVVS